MRANKDNIYALCTGKLKHAKTKGNPGYFILKTVTIYLVGFAPF